MLVSGALAAALFLTVLLLVNGWSIEPLAAAAAVSVLPAGGIRGIGDRRAARPPGPRSVPCWWPRGTACLAFLPTASVAWILVPQTLAGLGMGLALTALAGPLLPQRNAQDAARLLALRHAGIALALVLLAPVLTDRLDAAVDEAEASRAPL